MRSTEQHRLFGAARGSTSGHPPPLSVLVSAAIVVLAVVVAVGSFMVASLDGDLGHHAVVAEPSERPPSRLEDGVIGIGMPHHVEVAGTDPTDLPRFPGAIRVAHDEDVAGSVRWTRLEYVTEAPSDVVRTHYRNALRAYDWFVGEVAIEADDWRYDAHRGSREVTLAISPADEGTRVAVSVSDLVTPVTP